MSITHGKGGPLWDAVFNLSGLNFPLLAVGLFICLSSNNSAISKYTIEEDSENVQRFLSGGDEGGQDVTKTGNTH